MVLVMTIMQPDITKIPAQYRDVLIRNARRVVALQLTGVPEKKGAADAAESASEGVHNNHSTNLRDDLDMRFDDLTSKMDALTEVVGALRDSVSDQSRRLQGLEGQVEGVRNDARTDRAHLYDEVSNLHDRIDRVKVVTNRRQESS